MCLWIVPRQDENLLTWKARQDQKIVKESVSNGYLNSQLMKVGL